MKTAVAKEMSQVQLLLKTLDDGDSVKIRLNDIYGKAALYSFVKNSKESTVNVVVH